MFIEDKFEIIKLELSKNGSDIMVLKKFAGHKKYETKIPEQGNFELEDVVRVTIENNSDDNYWIIDEFYSYSYEE